MKDVCNLLVYNGYYLCQYFLLVQNEFVNLIYRLKKANPQMSNPFSWEKRYKRTWENLSDVEDIEYFHDEATIHNSYKKGIVRHFHIIVDCSESIELNDFIPSIRFIICKELKIFIKKFYSENPISILSLLIYRNNRVEKYSIIIDNDTNIDDFFTESGSGEFSLTSSLNVSLKHLLNDIALNDYIKEILVITPSIYTTGDFNTNLTKLENIKVHFLSLRGEIAFFQEIAKKTHGNFFVPIESKDISYFLSQFCVPSTISASVNVNMLKLAFPTIITEYLSCVCCLKPSRTGYICPICNTKICKLPNRCPICDTQLVINSSLVQSLYFCYPLEQFNKITDKNNIFHCRVCKKTAKETCPICHTAYCSICTAFLHTDLHFCIFCETNLNNINMIEE